MYAGYATWPASLNRSWMIKRLMNESTIKQCKNLLKTHEILKLAPHTEEDVIYFNEKLTENIKYYSSLDETRQMAMIMLAAIVGYKELFAMTDFHIPMEAGDYERASSLIHYQPIADYLRTGKHDHRD
jgi:hypothetical protein